MRSDTTCNSRLSKLWFLLAFLPVVALIFAGAYPNVPLYVRWDGTIAAPTQFLNATFKAGSGITFTDNGSNLTIIATGGGASTNSIVVIPGQYIIITTNATTTNIIYTISAELATNSVTVAAGVNVTVTTNVTTTNVIYTVAGTGGTLTNSGALCTNVAYSTNLLMDWSTAYNDYYMTNIMGNHMCVYPTNLPNGGSFSLSVKGASSFTNYSVYMVWPPSAIVTWLSMTNGGSVSLVTSNKTQFFAFLVRYSSTTTNVIASYKEEP